VEDEPEEATPIIAKAAGLDPNESEIVMSQFDFYTRDDQLTERWMNGGVQTFFKEVADFFHQQGMIDKALDDYSATVDASFYEKVQ
jgi:taurine transport system substrate-binding protein